MNRSMPPAPESATAASTSSTDRAVCRNSASLTTFTQQRYPHPGRPADRRDTGHPTGHTPRQPTRQYAQRRAPAAPVLTAAATAADLADDGRGADHRDGGPGRGDGRFLARYAARGRPVRGPGLHQGPQDGRVVVGRAPPRLAQRPAVDDPRVDQVPQIVDGRGSDPDPVEPLRGAEGYGRRQFYPAQAADLLYLGEFQPAIAADGEVPRHVPGHGQLKRRHEVIDVAELPALRASLDRQQPGRLEMPDHQRVDAVADEGGGPHHGDLQARVGPRRALRQMLDLQEITGHAAVSVGAQGGRLR